MRWPCRSHTDYLFERCGNVLLVIAADKIQQIGVEADHLMQRYAPRLRVGFGVVHCDLDIHVPEVDAMETFGDLRRVCHRIAGGIEPHPVPETRATHD